MKRVQFPGGITRREASIVGLPRQVRVDTQKNTLRLHDGQTPGGTLLASESMVLRSIAEFGGSVISNAGIRYVATTTELADLVPEPGIIVAVREETQNALFIWDSGANNGSGIDSTVSGYWRRFSSQANLLIQLAMHNVINMQYGGVAPVANQNITAWLTNGVVKLWDGADYQDVTPGLFARLLSEIGNYAGAVALPDRLKDTLVVAADLNAVTDTGWYRSDSADANAPAVTESLVFHSKIDNNTMMQIFYLQASATRDTYQRFKTAGTWGTWILVPGTTPARLSATAGAVADCNLATDSGWYACEAATANAPEAIPGMLEVIRRSSNSITQVWYTASSESSYVRKYASGVWTTWVRDDAGDTVSQAEAEAGIATVRRGWTANRVQQAIDAIIGSTLRALRTLGVGANGKVLGVSGGVLAWLTQPTGWTQIATGNLTGASVSVTGIPAYRELRVYFHYVSFAGADRLAVQLSDDNGSTWTGKIEVSSTTPAAANRVAACIVELAGTIMPFHRLFVADSILDTGSPLHTIVAPATLAANGYNALRFVSDSGWNFDSGSYIVEIRQ